ncbi:hypothetical protein MKX03_003229, partial [Papaver bracteatum]
NGNWVWVKQICSLSLLRVLFLSQSGIAEFPESICSLKHLRYLDLSYTFIKTFPSSFCQLYNLQTLRLKGCRYIKELPKDMRKLIGLEYFIFSEKGNNQLTQMPKKVSRFSKLKELSVFIVGIGKGYGIEELKHLNLLTGKLVIKNLGNSLPLKLFRGTNNVLQTLRISSCDAFVGFLPDNDQEQQLYLPHHRSNNFLSVIEIWRCSSLTVLPADFRGLSSLTYLAIKECRSLKSLPDGIQYLPALQKLIIGGFSKDLISFPFPASTRLDGEQYFISLRELTILGWPTLAVLPTQLQYLTSLHRLKISDFPCLLSLPEWFGELSSLQTLDIENCSKLEYLPSEEQMQRITPLQNLNIRNCPLLLERCRSGNEEWHKIAHIPPVSRSSPSLIDHITRDADMNVELLARRRFGIFSNENKEKCWIDSSGRNCVMLFPKSLHITWGDNTDYWTWLSIIEPSASDDAEIEVPELVNVCWLSVHGKLDMSKLSHGVNYEVVFVVMFREWSDGWGTPVDLCLMLPDGQRPVRKVNLETMPKSQWIEIHVGDFKTPQQPDDEETEVTFWLLEQEVLNWKKGLVIEGAIVRPKKQ